jgi:glutathione synthase/RimK-type ligase-like ATP-grasp enzyme
MVPQRPPIIAFVTYEAAPGLHPDDRLAAEALAEEGVRVEAIPWSSTAARWEEYALVILRSCWDYYRQPTLFLEWIAKLEELGVRLWNPADLVRWNADKHYLRELASWGVPVIPTVWLESKVTMSLSTLLEQEGWSRAVVKPRVSANAYQTWFTRPEDAGDHEDSFRRLLQSGGVLVQKFVPEVQGEGEWSFIFLGQAFSHAVLKRPAPGDFRTQLDHGGRSSPAVAKPALIQQAQRVVDTLPGPWLYARVDGCIVEGELRLMELEVIEPSLFLAHHSEAPRRFARAILDLIQVGGGEPGASPVLLYNEHRKDQGRTR